MVLEFSLQPALKGSAREINDKLKTWFDEPFPLKKYNIKADEEGICLVPYFFWKTKVELLDYVDEVDVEKININ